MFVNCVLQNESVPESLKNMLLVMHTAGILSSGQEDSQLWRLTWDRIDTLLPNLKYELFQPCEKGTSPANSPAYMFPKTVSEMINLIKKVLMCHYYEYIGSSGPSW
jgi:hypothetical protein